MTYIKKDDDILFLIRTLNKQLYLDFNKRSEELGITGPQARILLFIHHRDEIGEKVRQVDIEKNFNLSKSTVSGFMKRMEKNGIIKRINEKTSTYLIPDERGKTIIDNLAENRNMVVNKLLKGLNNEQKIEFMEYIKKALKNFEETEEETHVAEH